MFFQLNYLNFLSDICPKKSENFKFYPNYPKLSEKSEIYWTQNIIRY